MTTNELRFPKRFLWGASTSAHQVEGGLHNNWTVWEFENAKSLAKSAEYKLSALPIWEDIRKEATTPENYISGQAIDHYNRYESDFDIVKKMHLNAFRFSIEWSRLEPEEGKWNVEAIEHYRKYIKALKKRGIEPMITLYHWTVPVWFSEKGAFEYASNIKYFVRFAEKVLLELGQDLRYVITINEPDTVSSHGYFLQEHPPQKRSPLKLFLVYKNHLKAHREIYRVARRISRRFKVGFVKSYAHAAPLDARRTSQIVAWLDVKIRDSLVLRYVGRRQDFIGVNYYFTDMYSGFKIVHDLDHISDLGWEMKPEYLEKVLLRLKKYKKPIFVLETGVADMHDHYRKRWLNGTIRSVANALEAGVDVQGYMHWSLFDNFEWAYGKWPRFGLIKIDYANDMKRIPRKSAVYYAAFVKKMRGL